MLRLLLSLTTLTSLTPLPVGDEPEPKTAEARPRQGAKESHEFAEDQPDHRFSYHQNAYDSFWDLSTPVSSFTGDGSRLTVDFLPDDSDLVLAEPDDALRAQLRLPKDRGLLAIFVRAHGHAWTAGVRQNDVLLSLDDAPLAKPGDLDARLKQAGEKPMTLAVIRKGAPQSMKVQPQVKVSLGPVEQEEAPTYWIGVSVSTLDPALRSQLDVPENQGLLVTNVVEGGPAAKGGLKTNDVLLTVAGQPLNSQPALSELVQKFGEKTFEVEFIREGSRNMVSRLTPEKRKTGQSFKVSIVPTHPIGTTVVRPGVVQFGQNLPSMFRTTPSATPGGFNIWSPVNPGLPSKPDASTKRLDEMSGEIKELRKAIEGLRKVLEDRK